MECLYNYYSSGTVYPAAHKIKGENTCGEKWKQSLVIALVLALLIALVPAVYAAEPDATIAANAEKDLRYLALDDENNGPHDLYYQQKIMNPVVEDSFVLWYNGKNTNYPISWTSSNPAVTSDASEDNALSGCPPRTTP